MPNPSLRNKPLVEAVFELRWALTEQSPGVSIDPHYDILIGRIYDRVRAEYPFHEKLTLSILPDELLSYFVQHRFRKAKGKWPLIQIGPGIITLNDTKGYKWEDFAARIDLMLSVLGEAYPEPDSLRFDSLLLRYIDAVPFAFQSDDVFAFLRANMRTDIKLHPDLFGNTGVQGSPSGLDLRFSFASESPRGIVNLRYFRGRHQDADALVWETLIRSAGQDIPQDRAGVCGWAQDAHTLIIDWFFKLIEGELLRRFDQ